MAEPATPPYEVELDALHHVGLKDLTAVVEHRIEEHFGSVSHYVRFRNGGTLCFAFNANGALLELSGNRLTMRLDESDGTLLVGPYVPPGD